MRMVGGQRGHFQDSLVELCSRGDKEREYEEPVEDLGNRDPARYAFRGFGGRKG